MTNSHLVTYGIIWILTVTNILLLFIVSIYYRECKRLERLNELNQDIISDISKDHKVLQRENTLLQSALKQEMDENENLIAQTIEFKNHHYQLINFLKTSYSDALTIWTKQTNPERGSL
jgi:hypothetical protein